MTTELSPEKRAELIAANEREARQTAELAFRAQEEARLRGDKPVLTAIADSVRQKLEEQFPADQSYEEGAGTEGAGA